MIHRAAEQTAAQNEREAEEEFGFHGLVLRHSPNISKTIKKLPATLAFGAGINAALDFSKAVEKQVVVGDGLFDELFEQEHFRAADDGMDAVLEGFHGREGLEGVAEQKNGGMAALVDRHGLQRLQGQVFLKRVRRKKFLDDDDLVMDLVEPHQKIAVGGGGVDFVAQFAQGVLGDLQPFRRGEGDQGRFVLGADEIE